MSKHVFIVGDIGKGSDGYFHVGDEAMWISNINRYLSHGWNITASSRNQSDVYPKVLFIQDTKISNYKTFMKLSSSTHPEYQKIAKIIKNVDLVHISGGGNLNKLWRGHFYYRCLIFHIAKQLGKRVILTSQTVGPLDSKQIEVLSRYSSVFDYFGIRDRHDSFKYLKLAGFNKEQIHVDPDDALNVKFPILRKLPAEYFVAFHNSPNFRNFARIFQTQHSVCLTPHIVTDNSYEGKQEVIPLCLPKPQVADNRETLINWSIDSISTKSGGITSRYHVAVFALMQGVPVLAIAINKYYETKFKGLFNYFEIPSSEYIFRAEDIPLIKNVVHLLDSQKKYFNLRAVCKKIFSDRKRIYEIITQQKN